MLARMLGGRRTSIEKALQELQARRAVRLSDGAIEIVDLQRLGRLVRRRLRRPWRRVLMLPGEFEQD